MRAPHARKQQVVARRREEEREAFLAALDQLRARTGMAEGLTAGAPPDPGGGH